MGNCRGDDDGVSQEPKRVQNAREMEGLLAEVPEREPGKCSGPYWRRFGGSTLGDFDLITDFWLALI